MLGGKRSHVSAMTPDSRLSTETGPGVRPKLLQAVPRLGARGTPHRTNHTSEKTPTRLCGLARRGKSRFDGVARHISSYPYYRYIITVRNSSKAARPPSISPNSHCRAAVIRLRGAADIGTSFFGPELLRQPFHPDFLDLKGQLGLSWLA
jgi:hypothetical protein